MILEEQIHGKIEDLNKLIGQRLQQLQISDPALQALYAKKAVWNDVLGLMKEEVKLEKESPEPVERANGPGN